MWLDGILAVARQDQSALATARGTLRKANTATTVLLDLSLAAFEMELRGSRREAARTLAASEWERLERWVPGYSQSPVVAGVNRLAASHWLLAVGDTAQALRLLTWHEAIGGVTWRRVRYLFSALPFLARAQIAEAEGRRDEALEYYGLFLRRYDMPVPAHRHLVERARAAVALLEK